MSVSKHLSDKTKFITCIFAEEKDGKLIEKGTMCKMARGEMVRYMAEKQITDLLDLKNFKRLDYVFSEKHSDERTFTFIKK
jgi:cytoplasmic iron level regulating protein YaaA (DUF328/UPF0246 family)